MSANPTLTAAQEATYHIDDLLASEVREGNLPANLLAPLDERNLQTLSDELHRYFLGDTVCNAFGLPAVIANLHFKQGQIEIEPGRAAAITPTRIDAELAANLNGHGYAGFAVRRGETGTGTVALNSAGANALVLGHEVAHNICSVIEMLGVTMPALENTVDTKSVPHALHGPMFRYVHMVVLEALGVNRSMYALHAETGDTPLLDDAAFKGLAGYALRNSGRDFQWPSDVLETAYRNVGKDADTVVWNGPTVAEEKWMSRSLLRPLIGLARKAQMARPEYRTSEALQRPITKGGRFLLDLANEANGPTVIG